MAFPSLLTSVIAWLRAGYPDGVPENDYIPLVALLSRRLSPAEVQLVAHEVIKQGEHLPDHRHLTGNGDLTDHDDLTDNSDLPDNSDLTDNIDIAVIITKVTHELPSEEDVARVRSRLAARGWPLADPRESPDA